MIKGIQYRCQEVRDLAWVIGSCPLMQPGAVKGPFTGIGKAWCQDQLIEHQDWLYSLDNQPEVLRSWLEQHQNQLIGKKFENLFTFWMSCSPNFNLISSNVQLSESGKTTGEIDLIVKDRISGDIWVMEIACKYFLGVDKSSNWKNWIGPNGTDSLDQKLEKIPRQLMSAFNYSMGLYPKVQPIWLVKGYFFHHYSLLGRHRNPELSESGYQAGWYLRQNELKGMITDSKLKQWLVLPRNYWLSPFESEIVFFDLLDGKEMVEMTNEMLKVHNKAQLVIQVVQVEENIKEISRGFVVKAKWPAIR